MNYHWFYIEFTWVKFSWYTYLYKIFLKSIESEVVFTKIKKKNEGKVNLLQNSLLHIQQTYSTQFFIGRITSTMPSYFY